MPIFYRLVSNLTYRAEFASPISLVLNLCRQPRLQLWSYLSKSPSALNLSLQSYLQHWIYLSNLTFSVEFIYPILTLALNLSLHSYLQRWINLSNLTFSVEFISPILPSTLPSTLRAVLACCTRCTSLEFMALTSTHCELSARLWPLTASCMRVRHGGVMLTQEIEPGLAGSCE